MREKGHPFLVLFMSGFFFGIVYANLVAQKYVTVTGIFHEYFLSRFSQMELQTEDYLLYIAKCRLMPVVLVLLAARSRLKKPCAVLVILWTGFSFGILAVTAVLRLGAAGMILAAAGLMPQFLFYVPAYLVMLIYLYYDSQSKWTNGKTVFVAVMIAAGILLEATVNPWLVRAVWKLFG